jgi:predicted RNase H-like HicB family nuclease
MKSTGFTYWQDDDQWIGHLDEFPDYLTQGTSLEDLKAHLADLYQDLQNTPQRTSINLLPSLMRSRIAGNFCSSHG